MAVGGTRGPSAGRLLVTGGYDGLGVDKPRKYVKGELRDAYCSGGAFLPGELEYKRSCKALGAEPNSFVQCSLRASTSQQLENHELLGGSHISLRETYLGEKGFIAMLPILDRNTSWTCLDASNNGLRNEAILHLVDMLLRPHHKGRSIQLMLSRNPISEGGGRALLDLARQHPCIKGIDLNRTKVPRQLRFTIHKATHDKYAAQNNVCTKCGNLMMDDSVFCRRCGGRRPRPLDVGVFEVPQTFGSRCA